jgi:branched-chain amino acid transport system substrate-binding protein
MKRLVFVVTLACACTGKVSADAIGSPDTHGPQGQCATNKDCIDANGGQPYVCRKDDNVCVALVTSTCRRIASEPNDVANDETVWLGVVYPQTTVDGQQRTAAVDLARGEIVKVANGLPPAAPGGPRRPLAFLVCDEADEPTGTRHLLDDLKVPAIIGYGTADDFAAAAALAVPRGALLMGAGMSSPAFPQLDAGSPRLLWRTTPSDLEILEAAAKAVGAVLEPAARARPGAGSGPIKVAMLRPSDTYWAGLGGAAVQNVSFNGKSFADNGANGLLVAYDAYSTPSLVSAVSHVVSFEPDVVFAFGGLEIGAEIVSPIERAWTQSLRPLYLGVGWNAADWSDSVSRNLALEGRTFVVDVDPRATNEATKDFSLSFMATYPNLGGLGWLTTAKIGTSYDAAYALAGAAVAAGPTITGKSLSGAIPKLTSGAPYAATPSQLPGIFAALANGTIDLDGVSGPLDFHPDTGEVDADMEIQCITGGDAMLTGVFYRWASGTFEGQLSCR